MQRQTLFRAGEGGFASYRIPTLIALPHGRVIAFCEGRRDSQSDTGTICVLARISEDGGEHFGEPFIAAQDGENTVGNPTPVYDRDTGKLFLLLNGNLKDGGEGKILAGTAPRTVLLTSSTDDGAHFTPLMDLTAQLKRPDWTWYAMGPCHAVQLRSGRLLVPCNHAVLDPHGMEPGRYIAHTVYSDDHGQTWQLGEDVAPYTNECSLAELADGRVYFNLRSYHGKGCRAVAYSDDGGHSFGDVKLDAALPDPVCQGSVLAYGDGEVLLFSNAADAHARMRLTLRASMDGGETFAFSRVVQEGPAAYSDLAQLPGGRVACLLECGEASPYERIDFVCVDMDSLIKA